MTNYGRAMLAGTAAAALCGAALAFAGLPVGADAGKHSIASSCR